MRKFKNFFYFFKNLFKTSLLNVQIEISTFCNSLCIMCPRRFFLHQWKNIYLEPAIFEKVPFNLFRRAHLQGWGEPLLHPEIRRFIEIASPKTRVGLTTNGLLVERIFPVLSKLSYIAFSLGGATEETHKKIRNSPFKEIVKNIKRIASQKFRPKLILSIILFEENLEEIPKFLELSKSLGVESIVFNNLDYVPVKELEEKALFLKEEQKEKLRKWKILAVQKGKEMGIRVIFKEWAIEETLTCEEQPGSSVFITAEGKVCPCVYLHLPIEEEVIPRVFLGKSFKVKKHYFGDLKEKEFDEIWRSEDYQKFKGIYRARIEVFSDLLLGKAKGIPDVPEPCKSCYKLYGI